jgi:hypothetical protein
MKTILCVGLIAGLGALIAACGDSNGASCSDVAACGGNVVGDWKITRSCLGAATGNAAMASGLSSSCPSARTGDTNVMMSGSVSYRADMTFSQTTTVSGSVSVVLPASCLTQRGTTVTCDQINQLFKSTLASGGSAGTSGLPDISCSSAGAGSCSCTTSIPSQTSTTSGTYATNGSVLTQNGSSDDYCVQGNKLYLRPHQGTSMMSTMGTVSMVGQIELQKQ